MSLDGAEQGLGRGPADLLEVHVDTGQRRAGARGEDLPVVESRDGHIFGHPENLEDIGEVDIVFDVIGGDILDRSAALVRAGGTLVTITMPPRVQPKDGRAVFFVVEPDRARLTELVARLRDGRLTPVVGAIRPLAEAPAAFAPATRTPGKTIVRVTEE